MTPFIFRTYLILIENVVFIFIVVLDQSSDYWRLSPFWNKAAEA
jgi:hypothetical protein